MKRVSTVVVLTFCPDILSSFLLTLRSPHWIIQVTRSLGRRFECRKYYNHVFQSSHQIRRNIFWANVDLCQWYFDQLQLLHPNITEPFKQSFLQLYRWLSAQNSLCQASWKMVRFAGFCPFSVRNILPIVLHKRRETIIYDHGTTKVILG